MPDNNSYITVYIIFIPFMKMNLLKVCRLRYPDTVVPPYRASGAGRAERGGQDDIMG